MRSAAQLMETLSPRHETKLEMCSACETGYPRGCSIAGCRGLVHAERVDAAVLGWECDRCGVHGMVRPRSRAPVVVTRDVDETVPLRAPRDPGTDEWK